MEYCKAQQWAFDLVGEHTDGLLATERFCNILESSAEASVELQQLTSQEYALHELITALVTPSASFTLGAAAELSE